MKKASVFSIFATVLFTFQCNGAVTILYSNDFSTDSGSWTAIGDGSVSYNSTGGYVEVATSNTTIGAGGYSYGMGKTPLSAGFGTLTQSVDVYIDPSAEVAGTTNKWSLSTNIKTNTDVAIVDFDFWGKWVLDDGEGDANFADLDEDSDTTDWVYKIGRNNDWRTAPVLVENAGWYTFTSEWIDNGISTTIVNNQYIYDSNGTELFKGSTGATPATSATGYLTGYIWAYFREGAGTTLEIDNISYDLQPIPEPAAYSALLGFLSLLLMLIKRSRVRK